MAQIIIVAMEFKIFWKEKNNVSYFTVSLYFEWM